MPDAELIEKFTACLEWGGIDSNVADEVADRVLSLESQPSIRTVVAPLAAATARVG
jgi:hypothetical protein